MEPGVGEFYKTRYSELLDAAIAYGLVKLDEPDGFPRVVSRTSEDIDIGERIARFYLEHKLRIDATVRTMFSACDIEPYEQIGLPENFAKFFVEFVTLVSTRLSSDIAERGINEFLEACQPRIMLHDFLVLIAIVSVFGVK